MISILLALTVTFVWNPVTTDTAGNPVTIDHYRIYRKGIYASAYPKSELTRRYTTSYTATVNDVVDYRYVVTAVTKDGRESAKSDEAWLTTQPVIKSAGPEKLQVPNP